jgi:hypothetical protein
MSGRLINKKLILLVLLVLIGLFFNFKNKQKHYLLTKEIFPNSYDELIDYQHRAGGRDKTTLIRFKSNAISNKKADYFFGKLPKHSTHIDLDKVLSSFGSNEVKELLIDYRDKQSKIAFTGKRNNNYYFLLYDQSKKHGWIIKIET